MRLLIAIPVFNEEQYVDRVLDEVRRYHDRILVIDDGSTDDTPRLLARRRDIDVITHQPNRGYGRSLIDAFGYAQDHGYDWVITMDCDEQHEPRRIPDFIEKIHEDRWDLISGSRYLQPDNANDLPPAERRTINATITATVNDLLGLQLTDSFCGYKAHRTSAMARLRLDEEGYAFPMQLWPRAVQAGLRITEIPVRLIYNDPTRHFGGQLDNAGYRLRHYLEVLRAETERAPEVVEAAACCCCGK